MPLPNLSAPSSPQAVRSDSADAKFGDADFTRFGQRVEAKTGIRLSQYKSDQMRRRLATLAQQAGCTSFTAYADRIERDPAQMAELRDRVTINVTELLRNPDCFQELAAHVLPELLARRKGLPLSVWSAGCSYGAEAYTVSMLLHEITPGRLHRIKGTDIDQAVIARAERPRFSAADMLNISPARRAAHFQEIDGCYQPKMPLRTPLRFGLHDLLGTDYPQGEYDLILCRNVLIYFTEEAKERIYRGFFQTLRPGGVLFIGGTERLTDHRAVGFELLRPFFYRKPPV